MTALNHPAAWSKDIWLDAIVGRTIIDLPADSVLADDAVIDQIIDRIFDHLAEQVLELRVGSRWRAAQAGRGKVPETFPTGQ